MCVDLSPIHRSTGTVPFALTRTQLHRSPPAHVGALGANVQAGRRRRLRTDAIGPGLPAKGPLPARTRPLLRSRSPGLDATEGK